MLDIRSIQNFSLSDPRILFLDQLGVIIIQPPTKNDNDKLNKMQNIDEDSTKKIELRN